MEQKPSFSRDRARMLDTLDVIKFCCKDLWTIVFRKQIDNLKTNHRGVYVLTDNTFRPFARMSTEAGGAALIRAQPVRLHISSLPFAFSLFPASPLPLSPHIPPFFVICFSFLLQLRFFAMLLSANPSL